MRTLGLVFFAGALGICPALLGSSDQWTPFTFHVAPGACPIAPSGLDGSGVLRLLEITNEQGHMRFTFDATGVAYSPDGQRWIFGDHDAGAPAEDAHLTFLNEKFHLIGQGSAPNMSLSILLKIQPDGTVLFDKEHGLELIGCAGNVPF